MQKETGRQDTYVTCIRTLGRQDLASRFLVLFDIVSIFNVFVLMSHDGQEGESEGALNSADHQYDGDTEEDQAPWGKQHPVRCDHLHLQ